MHLNPFYLEGASRFHQTLKWSMAQNVKSPWSKVTVGNNENNRDMMNVKTKFKAAGLPPQRYQNIWWCVGVFVFWKYQHSKCLMLEINSVNFRNL
jgi:hypothetical protein